MALNSWQINSKYSNYQPSTLFSSTLTTAKPKPHKSKPYSLPASSLFCQISSLTNTKTHPVSHHIALTQTSPIPTLPAPSTVPRKPCKGCELANNSFQPHVHAAECLTTWETPFSLEKKLVESCKYPQEVIDSVNAAMLAGLAPLTKITYVAGLLRWSQYCNLMKIPETDRMPASDILIIGFMGYHLDKVSGSTVKNWLTGLRAWH